ncbi:hypothetical protein BZA77DRAFT_254877 [Pyronema omphalodes]|nr:hypothetical protein BZA77DRAFT_254877 [Pyronema omphalodes]
MVFIITLLTFCHLFTPAHSVPTSAWHPPHGNITALQNEIAPSWVAEPKERGTMSLLSSCTFTMFLCVYTAVHLNVPPPGEKKRYFYLRKAKWVLVALLAPEVVLYTAWSQWREARWLQTQNPQDHSNPQDNKISLMQCFFVVMGGFVIDLNKIKGATTEFRSIPKVDQSIFISADDERHAKPKPLTITAFGFSRSDIRHTPLKSIRDKSKADVLAKGLVCFQVLWMTIQTISRKIEGLPLTVLEIHTLVHVVCAIFMYVLWFEKPVDVLDAIEITDQEAIRAWGEILRSSRERINTTDPFSNEVWKNNAPNLDCGIGGKKTQQAILLVALCAAYGGVHLAAWNFEFPTNAEKLIWRIACIVAMAGTAVSWYIRYLFIVYTREWFKDHDGLMIMFRTSSSRRKIAIILTAIVAFFFVLARAVITVMSFTSLRKVPAGVYATVQWNDLVPHF